MIYNDNIMTANIASISSRSLGRYLEMESLLHSFFEGIGFCRENYGTTCNGCCNENIVLYPKKYYGCWELDEERLRIYGEGDSDRGCPYSSDKGCVLGTHKTPKCIAYVCPQFTKALIDQGIDYDWFEVRTLLNCILNEARIDLLSGLEIEPYCISDKEFSELKRRFDDSIKIWSSKAAK